LGQRGVKWASPAVCQCEAGRLTMGDPRISLYLALPKRYALSTIGLEEDRADEVRRRLWREEATGTARVGGWQAHRRLAIVGVGAG
jgi:hypothetical protein